MNIIQKIVFIAALICIVYFFFPIVVGMVAPSLMIHFAEDATDGGMFYLILPTIISAFIIGLMIGPILVTIFPKQFFYIGVIVSLGVIAIFVTQSPVWSNLYFIDQIGFLLSFNISVLIFGLALKGKSCTK